MASKDYVRRGDLFVTKKQYAILCQLRDALKAEQPLVRLAIKTKYDENTLSQMQHEKDWIVSSTKIFGELRYAITGRGLAILKILEAPRTRALAPDLCHVCGLKPRYVSPRGKRSSYCQDCQNTYNRAWHAQKGHGTYRSDTPCSCCKTAPRHISKNGRRETYCLACRRAKGLERKRHHYERALTRAQTEGLPLCKRCGKQPQLITAHTVHALCRDCFNARRRERNRRLKIQRIRAIQQRLKGFRQG